VFFKETKKLSLSNKRFTVTYKIFACKEKALEIVKDICLEQTVEFPEEFLPFGPIKDFIVGKIEKFEQFSPECYIVKISYAAETVGREFTQLLNVVFGNISMKSNIKVERLLLNEDILKLFKGPRFGIDGTRKYLGIEKRPLLFTALKPMGLSNFALANLAYNFALAGIDIIKDDHGLSDQEFCRFEERVVLCAEAVKKANKETGLNCIYVPNITAPFHEIKMRAKLAKDAGAGGLLIAPGLVGFDTMRNIAEDNDIALPIFSHPSFQGSYVLTNSGISHFVMFGQLVRLAGADVTIYPNFGGRFPFTKDECKQIVEGAKIPMGNIKPIFPSPAGGMSIESIPDAIEIYGNDVIFLIGSGLFRKGPDIMKNCRYFKSLVEKY